MKKILFVLEKGKKLYYGAETSLKEYIEELSKNKDIEIHLLVRKSILSSEEDIMTEVERFFYGIDIKKIYILPLPLKKIKILSKLYNKRIDIKGKIAEIMNDIIWKIYSEKKYREILKQEKFTIIHINTLHLYKLTNICQNNFFIHVRNIFDEKSLKENLFYNLKGVIAIANDVYEPLKNLKVSNRTLILNNPVNGNRVKKILLEEQEIIYKKYKIDKKEVIVSLIGRISPEKGVIYAINEFNNLKRKDIKLLIIGEANDKAYETTCKKLAYKNENIKFIPVTSKIELFYSISDYVLRADDVVGIGRTHLEGLFSGNYLIIPGTMEFINNNENLKRHKNQIMFYSPQEKNALTKILYEIRKINKDKTYSNQKDYVEKMLEFYDKMLLK